VRPAGAPSVAKFPGETWPHWVRAASPWQGGTCASATPAKPRLFLTGEAPTWTVRRSAPTARRWRNRFAHMICRRRGAPAGAEPTVHACPLPCTPLSRKSPKPPLWPGFARGHPPTPQSATVSFFSDRLGFWGVAAGDWPRGPGVAKSACRRNPPKHQDLRRGDRDLSTWPRVGGPVPVWGPLTPPAGPADPRQRPPQKPGRSAFFVYFVCFVVPYSSRISSSARASTASRSASGWLTSSALR
jgi:hypothetical protein